MSAGIKCSIAGAAVLATSNRVVFDSLKFRSRRKLFIIADADKTFVVTGKSFWYRGRENASWRWRWEELSARRGVAHSHLISYSSSSHGVPSRFPILMVLSHSKTVSAPRASLEVSERSGGFCTHKFSVCVNFYRCSREESSEIVTIQSWFLMHHKRDHKTLKLALLTSVPLPDTFFNTLKHENWWVGKREKAWVRLFLWARCFRTFQLRFNFWWIARA